MGQLTAYFGGGRRSKTHVVLCGSIRVFLLWSSPHQRRVTWNDDLSDEGGVLIGEAPERVW